MAVISMKVFVGANEKATRDLTDVEVEVMKKSLPGADASEKLDNLIDKVVEYFQAKPGYGNSWWDYQLERTGKTNDEGKAIGMTALAALPDKE